MLNGLVPTYLSNNNIIRTQIVHQRNTRQMKDLRPFNYKDEKTRRNVFIYGIIKSSNSLNIFKEKCAKHVMDNFNII